MSGTTLRGLIKLNDTLLLGPDPLGNFLSIAVKSIHRKRMPVKEVRGGQTASFALKKVSVGNALTPLRACVFEARGCLRSSWLLCQPGLLTSPPEEARGSATLSAMPRSAQVYVLELGPEPGCCLPSSFLPPAPERGVLSSVVRSGRHLPAVLRAIGVHASSSSHPASCPQEWGEC